VAIRHDMTLSSPRRQSNLSIRRRQRHHQSPRSGSPIGKNVLAGLEAKPQPRNLALKGNLTTPRLHKKP
jgi:hypothetical protein